MRKTLTAGTALIAAAHPRRATYAVTSITRAGPTPALPGVRSDHRHVLVSNVSANTVTDLEIGAGPTGTFAAGTTPAPS